MRYALVAVLLLVTALAWSEDVDVLTLRDGRVIEGQYDELTGTMHFVTGKLKGAVKVDPKDIVRREKKRIEDAPPAPPPEAEKPDPEKQAKRDAATAGAKRNQLKAELTKAQDFLRLHETNVAKMEAELKILPDQLKPYESRIRGVRNDLNSAENRVSYLQNDYDYWYGHYHSAYGNQGALNDARNSRDRLQQDLTKLERERDALQKKMTKYTTEIPTERSRMQSAQETITRLQEELQKLEGAEAAPGGAPSAPPPPPPPPPPTPVPKAQKAPPAPAPQEPPSPIDILGPSP
jgi:flagellar biosynthesis chaperone FliJ